MGIRDKALNESTKTEDDNPYLINPLKGMELIAKLLPRKMRDSKEATWRRLDYMIDSKLMTTLRSLGLKDALGLSQQLEKISDQISEYQKIHLLKGKVIIGIGGKFSAGKSMFINSILSNKMILPEGLNPTTSIPTYVVAGEAKEEIQAFSGGREEQLDHDAMQAITHAFYEKYGIGFSRFIQTIVIHTPDFPDNLRKHVAFLDTPGYNKADTDAREKLTDERLAINQLKTVDYLIWLVDIENGVVQNRDIDFMQSTYLKTPILIVFNKADKKDEEDCRIIVENSQEILEDTGLDIFGVTAYSSKKRKESFDQHLVDTFLSKAAESAAEKLDEGKNLKKVIDSITGNFRDAKEQELNRQQELAKDIRNVRQDINAIRSLVDMYGHSVRRTKRLFADEKHFSNLADDIWQSFKTLTK